MWDFPLFPEQASTVAGKVDALYFALILLSAIFAVPISILIVYFAVKYRTGARVDRTHPPHASMKLELAWIVIPLALAMGIFVWASSLYLEISRPPARSLQIYVVGKQWMWKFQHPEGQREINELHVPVGQPIKLVMASQDVIHSFYVPAFRVKQDVIPGRYTEVWFEATTTGEYHLHCTEYCGAQHADMGGRVVVMDPGEYQAWLSGARGPGAVAGGPEEGVPSGRSMAATGEELFQQVGCSGCHRPDGGGVGPSLVGVFGQPQPLEGGQTVIADEEYIRNSILMPNDQIVAGYEPVMPSYEGQLGEEQLLQIIEYIKSLGTSQPQEDQQ